MQKHPLKKTLVSQFFSPHLFDSIATSLQPVVASAITAVRRRGKRTKNGAKFSHFRIASEFF